MFDCSAYLTHIMGELDFPADAMECLSNSLDRVLNNATAREILFRDLDRYEQDIHLSYRDVLVDMEHVAEMTGVHRWKTELILFLLYSKHLREVYLSRNVDLSIFHDSMLDLKWKLLECYAVKRMWGCFCALWFPGFFSFDRFALGRLQFELIPFTHAEFRQGGKVLKKGDPVINVHIPRTLTPLDGASCDTAFAMARSFFSDRLGDTPAAFYCYSWLLYPAYDNFLPETSNIRAFRSRFSILGQQDDGEDEHPDLWRLFDVDYTGDPYDLPGDTSLRRSFREYLIQGGKTGNGYGVFFA